jgi:hypothetical protein
MTITREAKQQKIRKHTHEYVVTEWKRQFETVESENVSPYVKEVGFEAIKMNCKFCPAYALKANTKVGFYFYEN